MTNGDGVGEWDSEVRSGVRPPGPPMLGGRMPYEAVVFAGGSGVTSAALPPGLGAGGASCADTPLRLMLMEE